MRPATVDDAVGDAVGTAALPSTAVAHGATVAVMPETISQRELRNDSGEIMRMLDRGQSFVVTRNGTPVGSLTPLRRPPMVGRDAVVAAFVGAPAVDGARLRADLDRWTDQAAAPRG